MVKLFLFKTTTKLYSMKKQSDYWFTYKNFVNLNNLNRQKFIDFS